LRAGTWRFIKSCLPIGATQEFYFPTPDGGNPSPFTRDGYYLTATLNNIVGPVFAIPYAIEEIKAQIFYNTGSGQNYTELITLPYWKSGWVGKYWDSNKFAWFPPFWTFLNSTGHPYGGYLYIYSPHHTEAIIIRALWLPKDVAIYAILWQQYPYEIAKFTYYEVLLALSEWDEANMVWQECGKISQEMRQQHGVKKLIIPYQQVDYLNPQAQAVRGGGE
jgi:hypothetical protein